MLNRVVLQIITILVKTSIDGSLKFNTLHSGKVFIYNFCNKALPINIRFRKYLINRLTCFQRNRCVTLCIKNKLNFQIITDMKIFTRLEHVFVYPEFKIICGIYQNTLYVLITKFFQKNSTKRIIQHSINIKIFSHGFFLKTYLCTCRISIEWNLQFFI